MKKLVGVSRVLDYELREKVLKFSDEEREALIQEIGVTHAVFENWVSGKSRLGSKNRNKLMHLVMG